jgi:Xaa-Pro dipeptidase
LDVPPMIYSGNSTLAAPGMALFLHAILVNTPRNLAMSLDHTLLITESGSEALSQLAPEYSVCM